MRRRTLLGGFGAASLIAGAPSLGADAAAAPVWRSDSAAILGSALRRAALVEREPAALTAVLTQELGTSPETATQAALTAKVRHDYQAGRLVVLDGWALSLTEARLCALADALG